MKYNLTVLVAAKFAMPVAVAGAGDADEGPRRVSMATTARNSVVAPVATLLHTAKKTPFSVDNVDVPRHLREAADALERSCLMVKREMAERYHTPYNVYVEENAQIVAKLSERQNDGYGFYDVAMVPQLMLAHVLAVEGEREVSATTLLRAVRLQRAAAEKEGPDEEASPLAADDDGGDGGGDGDGDGDDERSETSLSTLRSGQAPSVASAARGSVSAKAFAAAAGAVADAKRSGKRNSVAAVAAVSSAFTRDDAEEQLLLVGALKRFEVAAASIVSGLAEHHDAIMRLKLTHVEDDDGSVESSDSVLSMGSGRYYKSKKFGRNKMMMVMKAQLALMHQSRPDDASVPPAAVLPPVPSAATHVLMMPPKNYAVDVDTAAALLAEAAAAKLPTDVKASDDLATTTANKDVALVADLVDVYQSLRLMARGDEPSLAAVAQGAATALGDMGVTLSNTTGKVKVKKEKAKANRYPSGHVRELCYGVTPLDTGRDSDLPVTVKGELTPFNRRHGRTMVTATVQWALAMTGGIGYGFMGLPSTSSLADGSDANCMATERGSVLWEVYCRLVPLEGAFRKKEADAKLYHWPYRTEEQRTRFVLNAVMAKVCVPPVEPL